MEDEETLAMNDMTVYYDAVPADADEEDAPSCMTYLDAVSYFEENGFDEPDPADYGVWVPGVPGADRQRSGGCRRCRLAAAA